MGEDDNRGWKRFHKLSIDKKNLSRHVKKAEGATVRHANKFILNRLDSIRAARRHIIVWLLLVGVIISAVGLQFVWFQQGYQTTAAAEGGTYAEASLGPIDTLNPLYVSSSAEAAASRLMFSSLYSYDRTGHLKGDLATNITSKDDDKVYVVKIRSDAKWHDGTKLTAKDIAFTINLIKNTQTRSPLRATWRDVHAAALDDTTIQFTLPAAYAAFPHALTFAVLPKHILEKVAPGAIRENTYSRAPIGSGPFEFKLLQTASSSFGGQHKAVHMVVNNSYYGGLPRLNRFEVHAYDTQEQILKALQSGEVNAAADLPGELALQANSANYEVSTKPIDSGMYALFNNTSTFLKDKSVRQALQLATDTKEIRDNLSVPTPSLDLPFINGQLTGGDIPSAPATNLEKAKQLLDTAGWKLSGNVRKKDGKALTISITTTKNVQYEKTLEVLAGQWRKLGISVSTQVLDPEDPTVNFVQNVLQARNYDVLLYELFIGADPDVYAYWSSSQIGAGGYNFANYSNGEADAALSSARSRTDRALRNAKYVTFAKQWLDDAPAVGLYQSVVEYVANKHTKSVDPTATIISSTDRYDNILYWSVNQQPVYKTP